jgi:hypothetical protein
MKYETKSTSSLLPSYTCSFEDWKQNLKIKTVKEIIRWGEGSLQQKFHKGGSGRR